VKNMKINDREIKISHPHKKLFKDAGVSKEKLIEYHKRMASKLLPYIKNRPITMERYPEGVESDGFYMKAKPEYFTDWIKTIDVEKIEGGTIQQIICDSEETLVYLINQGTISCHAWLSSISQINQPDRLIFDLDPSVEDHAKVKKAALTLKAILDAYDMPSFLMMTGSRGLHIWVPIEPDYGFEYIRKLALALANKAVEKEPKLLTTKLNKDQRGNKVFIDTLRNAYGQTSVVPYSVRALPQASIACPLNWIELKNKAFKPRRYTIQNIFHRLGQVKNVWQGFNQTRFQMRRLINFFED
jgi:bifunctional non-homologous end joining protein LigD